MKYVNKHGKKANKTHFRSTFCTHFVPSAYQKHNMLIIRPLNSPVESSHRQTTKASQKSEAFCF